MVLCFIVAIIIGNVTQRSHVSLLCRSCLLILKRCNNITHDFERKRRRYFWTFFTSKNTKMYIIMKRVHLMNILLSVSLSPGCLVYARQLKFIKVWMTVSWTIICIIHAPARHGTLRSYAKRRTTFYNVIWEKLKWYGCQRKSAIRYKTKTHAWLILLIACF